MIRIPGVQKPHCSAKCLRNAACNGVRASSFEIPSIVTIFAPSHLNRQDKAGSHRDAIDDHRARTAGAMGAAHMGAGEAQIMTKAISQRGAWLYLHLDLPAIDTKATFITRSLVFTAGAGQSPFHKGGEQSASIAARAMNVVGWIDNLRCDLCGCGYGVRIDNVAVQDRFCLGQTLGSITDTDHANMGVRRTACGSRS